MIVIPDNTKLEMVMSMYYFVCPRIVLDTRFLQVIWKFANRLPNFYNKFEPIEEIDVPGPSGLEPTVIVPNVEQVG